MDVIKNVPFSPTVTGGLLYLLTRSPDRVKKPVLEQLSRYLSQANIQRTVRTLKWLLALGLARNFHVFLSEIAQNNFRLRSERSRYDWPKEIAVVTGAASGFGALISRDLAAKGVNVMAVDIRDELPEDMRGISHMHYYKCDITDRQAVMDLAEQIKREHGFASILVNNAGVAYRHTILDASEKALNNLYNVNIISHYWTLQAFLPDMIKHKKGHVVALASMASFLSPPGLIPYCNTKAAVLSLHDGLQQEMRTMYKCPEIKFTSIHPTYAATPMTQEWSSTLKIAKVTVRFLF
jgi:NAD(P)-dependent dehydrogenase (short-subunit alcohol dehydrogenase family)